MAIGAYMALRTCSEEQARAALIAAARRVQIGLGAVSQALLTLVSDLEVSAEPDTALTYWTKHLASPRTVTT